jgi:hypothetical protein
VSVIPGVWTELARAGIALTKITSRDSVVFGRRLKQEERAPMYEQAIRQIVADSPDIWIYNSMLLQGINKRVKGRRFCTVGQGAEMRWVSLGA